MLSFYNDLGVQVITVCFALREKTGGMIEVSDCLRIVNRIRGERFIVTLTDLEKAIEQLQVLGRGL